MARKSDGMVRAPVKGGPWVRQGVKTINVYPPYDEIVPFPQHGGMYARTGHLPDDYEYLWQTKEERYGT